MHKALPLLAPLALLCLGACSTLGSDRWNAIDTRDGRRVDLEQMADHLAGYDVVFLGEEHDNDVGHRLQLELTELLLERRGELVVSLEQFERDAQDQLDLYLRGAIDEQRFLANARPWGNYAEHYRPVVELARERGLKVVAANAYRPLASRVSKQGLASVAGDPRVAAWVDAGPGAYRDKFTALMGGHAESMGARMGRFFAAQCLKDDTMAESIARLFPPGDPDPPLVVHWCGRFHSDEYLGTVERLARRRGNLSLAVVSMVSEGSQTRELTEEERGLGDYVWLVPPMKQE